jgi:hypothetical protein
MRVKKQTHNNCCYSVPILTKQSNQLAQVPIASTKNKVQTTPDNCDPVVVEYVLNVSEQKATTVVIRVCRIRPSVARLVIARAFGTGK